MLKQLRLRRSKERRFETAVFVGRRLKIAAP
jgi:hypothetical protein